MSDPIAEFSFMGRDYRVFACGYVEIKCYGTFSASSFDPTALNEYVDAEIERRNNADAERINQLFREMVASVAESAPFDEDDEESVDSMYDSAPSEYIKVAPMTHDRNYLRKLIRKEVKRALKKMAPA